MDAGLKRCGIAETDVLQMIASPRETVETSQIEKFLEKFLQQEPVEAVVLGYPAKSDGNVNEDVEGIYQKIIRFIQRKFPSVAIHRIDERFTSKLAQRALVESGMKKKDRQKKEILDQVSAAIILQDFLETRR
ncbi:Holliday junction resolvase RuvX [Thermaurantimonas aggregans]|uniref:Holliday junction resolvase RuvX n=1 Tax=Thermaurantimonas aggregans TaxID=2173829 RepID=UPI0023F0BB39|nr:Holliday junction resolvase RuvX [Thermaurantimonas aggregans]MCX8148926.1 Holliday junction resolvase RuvX [Thermaurantimonas aggregans]